ncbi:MAG: histidine phosphatase family protein [Lachnospiraceae bacterium]|nr:histidine phosphatase family protein [Lachnospiraceae bacterium]
MRLILVRHGEPDYKNDRLTEKGIIQAELTAQYLKRENIKTVYSSPMGRAYHTAEYTARAAGVDLEVLDFMHEIDWGDISPCSKEDKLDHDGHPWALGFKLLTEEPGYVGSNDWEDHHFFKDNKCMEYYYRISDLFDAFISGHGYTRKDGLYFCTDECRDTIALFAHGGSGAIMLSHLLNLPFPFVLTTMPFGLCSISVIELWPEKDKLAVPILELFNYRGHLNDRTDGGLTFEK